MASAIEPMIAGVNASNFAHAKEEIEALQTALDGALKRVAQLEQRFAEIERITAPTPSA